MYGSVNVILYALTTSSVLTSNKVTSVGYGQLNPLRTDHQFNINFKQSNYFVRYGQRNPLRTDHQFDINFKRSNYFVRYGQRNPLRTDHQFDINFKRSLQQFYLLILKYVSACQNLGSDKQNK